jgi:hypothetical protein
MRSHHAAQLQTLVAGIEARIESNRSRRRVSEMFASIDRRDQEANLGFVDVLGIRGGKLAIRTGIAYGASEFLSVFALPGGQNQTARFAGRVAGQIGQGAIFGGLQGAAAGATIGTVIEIAQARREFKQAVKEAEQKLREFQRDIDRRAILQERDREHRDRERQEREEKRVTAIKDRARDSAYQAWIQAVEGAY